DELDGVEPEPGRQREEEPGPEVGERAERGPDRQRRSRALGDVVERPAAVPERQRLLREPRPLPALALPLELKGEIVATGRRDQAEEAERERPGDEGSERRQGEDVEAGVASEGGLDDPERHLLDRREQVRRLAGGGDAEDEPEERRLGDGERRPGGRAG